LCNIISELIDLSDKGNIGVQKMKNSEQTNRKFTGVLSMLGGPPFSFPGIDWLASSMGMSRRSFTAFFLKNTGMSAMDYFMRNKMIYAQNLMDSNEFSLKEIAFQCGYSNPQNFQRAYKAYFKAD
jgi:transcriptional regulator GlxA family with amidase domain